MGQTTNLNLYTFTEADFFDYNKINGNSTKIDTSYKEVVDTLGKLINKNGWCTEIKTSTSVNNVLTTGFYFASAWTDTPNGSAYGYLICIALSPAKKQIFFAHGDNNVYTRTFRGGQWQSWTSVPTFETTTSIPANSHLNTFTTPGLYHSPSTTITSSLSDCPVTQNALSLFVKASISGNYREQYLLSALNESIYYRRTSDANNNWTAWRRISASTTGTATSSNDYCAMTVSWELNGGICCVNATMTPSQAISSSTGGITFSGLPTPLQGAKALVYNADDMHYCTINYGKTVSFAGGSFTKGTEYYSTVVYRANN